MESQGSPTNPSLTGDQLQALKVGCFHRPLFVFGSESGESI
jgi:hypothetical protein